MSTLTPREIVAELDKFVVGQEQAKRMVAVAVRNRWRRQHLPEELRDEVAPKNIIMMGPTGVGKTEIARRLAKLSGAPFIKVEATKFTEVGYVGRDVESMVRDLMEIGINLVREEENARVRAAAEAAAESRLLDLLLPNSFGGDRNDTREKLRQQFRLGFMDDREVEVEVTEQPAQGMDMFAIPGMEQMGNQVRDMFSKAFPPRRNRRKMKVREAYNVLIQEESGKLVDQEALVDKARERVEQMGIIFIDEIDKIAGKANQSGADVSREGVQRDILPIVEGSTVMTKYGPVKTDFILFIAAGAFHVSKVEDLIPELQGRFPITVELQSLSKEDFKNILTQPQNAITTQYAKLLKVENIDLVFTDDAIDAVAQISADVNSTSEDIGARRLHTVMEHLLEDISFNAGGDYPEFTVTIDKKYVEEHLETMIRNRDLKKYVL